MDIAPTGVENCTRYTTTTQLQPAKAEIGIGLASGRSREGDALPSPESKVEADLDKYGIDVDFIGKAAEAICWELDLRQRTWREACRIMGRRGAAAAMIAVAQKELDGQVKSPGAYLRGMTHKATIGELHLGRTFHGLRETAHAH